MNRVNDALSGEVALLDPAVRSNREVVDALLHPDFAERGQSGRWWTRDHTLRTLPVEAQTFESPEVGDLAGTEIADGVVLVTYVSGRGSGSVGRSSLWIEHEGRMRIRWHQGTPLPSSSASVRRTNPGVDDGNGGVDEFRGCAL